MLSLRKNTRKLLTMIEKVSIIEVNELLAVLGVSKRSLYYVIGEVNDILEEAGVLTIKLTHQVIEVSSKQRLAIQSLLQQVTIKDFVLTPEERVLLLIVALLTKYPFDSRQYMAELGIPKTTFYEDINRAKVLIEQHHCRFLKVNSNYYYTIQGSHEYLRMLLINTIKELCKTVPLSSITWMPASLFEDYERRFLAIHEKKPLLHNQENLMVLMTLLYFGYCEAADICFVNQPELVSLVQRYFPEYSLQEVQFLTFLLYGGPSTRVSGHNHLFDCCKELVDRFEEENHLRFEDKPVIIQEIYSHLLIHEYLFLSEDYRIQRGTIEAIKHQYHELYLKVIQCIELLSYRPLLLSDDFVVVGMMLKLGVYLRRGAFTEVEDVVFVYIDDSELMKRVMSWLVDFDQQIRLIDMMDFTYMPEEEKKAKLIITNVIVSEAFKEIPTVMITDFSIEEKIRVMLLLTLNQQDYHLETTIKVFTTLKDDMSTHQLQYYIKQLVR